MNKDNFYQFIVIGSGPAGSTASYYFADKGYSVVMLDGKLQPRYKPCGGAVPGFVQKLFDFDLFETINSVPIYSAYFTFRGKKDLYTTLDNPVLYGVDRTEFDYLLYKKAKEKGVKALTDELVTNVKEFDDYVEVTTKNGKIFKGKFLVGADGASSIVRSKLFQNEFKKTKTSTSAVWEVYDLTRELFNKYQNCVHLDFNWHSNGYFGLIPKFDHFTLGGYVSRPVNAEVIKNELKKFCNFLNINTDYFKPVLRYFSCYDKHRMLHTRRCVLAGDAACLTDALSGEGIKYAVMSAIVATKILEYALHGKMELKEYSRVIQTMIGEELLLAKKMAAISYLFPSIAYDGMIRVAEDSGKILNGEMSYSEFVERLTKKIKRKFFGIFNPLSWIKK